MSAEAQAAERAAGPSTIRAAQGEGSVIILIIIFMYGKVYKILGAQKKLPTFEISIKYLKPLIFAYPIDFRQAAKSNYENTEWQMHGETASNGSY